MNSLTVSRVCDHSSSVYLDPTSTGTVRQPATDLKYSMLCRSEKMNQLNTTVIPTHKKNKKLFILDSSNAQKHVMCALLDVTLRCQR